MSYSTHFVSLLAAIEKLWYGELGTDNVFLTNTEQQNPHPKNYPLFHQSFRLVPSLRLFLKTNVSEFLKTDIPMN